jgi:hypothetical protein
MDDLGRGIGEGIGGLGGCALMGTLALAILAVVSLAIVG